MFISIIKIIRQPLLRHDGCPPYSTLHSMFTSWSEIVKFVNNCQTLKQLSIFVKKNCQFGQQIVNMLAGEVFCSRPSDQMPQRTQVSMIDL